MAEKKKKKQQIVYVDLNERFSKFNMFRVPTGIIAFDRVIGGGVPSGRLTEIYGDFGSGKSRIACRILAKTHELGGKAMLIDTEKSLDKGLADLTGLDINHLLYPDPIEEIKTIESVFELIEFAVVELRNKNPEGLLTIVWDSVAATPGMEDLENELGANMAAARRAKVISDGLKKIMSIVNEHKICLVFINQIREKFGVMYGEKVETIGGRALKYTASLRIHIKIAGGIKNEKTKEMDGYNGRWIVERAKVCKPFGVVNFPMLIDKPIDKYAGLLDYMVRHGEAESSAGWYNFPGETKKWRAEDFAEYYECLKKEDGSDKVDSDEPEHE